MSRTDRSIVFAGGGSGGHLAPGLAIAERVADLAPDVPVAFACSRRPIDSTMLADAGVTFEPVSAAPLGRTPGDLVRFVRETRRGTREAHVLLERWRAGVVVSLGGFVTGPVVRAARRRGDPILLVNLDATPGRANRVIARVASRIVTAVAAPALDRFNPDRTGFPLRRSVLWAAGSADAKRVFGFAPDRPVLLVTGASQGARSLNRFMALFAAASHDALDGWQVLHLSGDADAAMLEQAYRSAGVVARVEPFLHGMGAAWGAADLAISRAGANSVAEIGANRVPAILVPYPYHRDLHQRWNATPLVDAGAARLELDLVDPAANQEGIGRVLRSLLADRDARSRMRAAASPFAERDGAAEIAERALDLRATGRSGA